MTETEMIFTAEVGTTNRFTVPPEVVKALGIVEGDVLQFNVSKVVHIKEA